MNKQLVLTQKMEVTPWWFLKTMFGVGMVPVVMSIFGSFAGLEIDIMVGMMAAGLMIVYAVIMAAAIILVKPGIVSDTVQTELSEND